MSQRSSDRVDPGAAGEQDGQKYPHVSTTERLRRGLDRITPGGWYVREEKPVRIPDFDEPQPDLAVVRGDIEQPLVMNHASDEAIVLPHGTIHWTCSISKCCGRSPNTASAILPTASSLA